MSSDLIYQILSEKSKSTHYLNRYLNFIKMCREKNSIHTNLKFENHHICPAAKDMYPEYSKESWNIVGLTPRQHYLAHWMTFKIFRNQSQSYAFRCFAKGRSNKYQNREPSKLHDFIMRMTRKEVSEFNRGKAVYYKEDGTKIVCSTNDPNVLSGLYVSTTKGRSSGKRSDEWKYKHSLIIARTKSRNMNRQVNLYFLENKITVLLYSTVVTEYVEQGWSFRCTKEFRSKASSESNRNRAKKKRD